MPNPIKEFGGIQPKSLGLSGTIQVLPNTRYISEQIVEIHIVDCLEFFSRGMSGLFLITLSNTEKYGSMGMKWKLEELE